jgi:hypothetical protein
MVMGGGTVKSIRLLSQLIQTPKNLRTFDYIKNNTEIKFQMPWEILL